MSDVQDELLASLAAIEEKGVHFAQTHALHDTSLEALRDRIKKVMIPLLIRAFQFSNESETVPKSQENHEGSSLTETCAQLKTLDNDLKNLQLWCQNCRGQIQKALNQSARQKPVPVIQASHESFAGKKFINCIAGRVFRPRSSPPQTELCKESPSWWRRFIKK
jgi:hypothetical protein